MPTIADIRKQYPQYDDLSDTDLASALHKKFYSDMDFADFSRRIGLSEKPAKPATQSKLGGLVDSFTQGVSFGFGDELTAAESAILGRTPEGGYFNYNKPFGERYNTALEAERGQQKQFREENPVAATAAEIAGGVATGAGLAGKGATLVGRAAGKGLGTRVGAGVVEGAGYGALYGAGSAEDDRVSGAGIGALTGGVVGGGIPAVGSALRVPFEAARRRASVAAAPTNEALRSAAKQAYQVADDAGLQFSQRGYLSLKQGISDDLATGGYNARLNPKISAVLDELKGLEGTAPTLQRLEQVRRVALNASNSAEPSERMLAGRIIENIDEFVDKISPQDIVSGTNRTKAVMALKEARETWKRLRKSELLDEAFEKAQNQASGFENGLRTQFRSILNNKKLRSKFNKEELTAMVKVVRGGPAENALKLLGKFGFGTDGASNMLGGTIGVGLGGVVGGPVGSMAAAGIGTAARKGAEAATRSNAEYVRALVRAGQLSPRQAPAMLRALESGMIEAPAIAGLTAGVN